MNLRTVDTFHRTRLGYLVFGLAELVLAIVLANLALDSGSLWQWALAFILLIGFLQNFVRMIAARSRS